MLLSIVIPVYNNEKNLSRCLQNLKQQTVFDLYKNQGEVIIVDDGSTSSVVIPAPVGILASKFVRSSLPTGVPMHFASSQPPQMRGKDTGGNIQVYRIVHSGAAKARNFGFQKSSGQYVFFCDSDVVFLQNNALEKMIKILEQNPEKAYCYSAFKFGWKKFKLWPFDAAKLKNNNYISTMSMVRRSALEKLSSPNIPWDESLKKFQDWDLWLSLLEIGESGIFLPEVLWQAKSGGTMSSWLPKLFYKIFKSNAKVQEYEKAKEIIIKKHSL